MLKNYVKTAWRSLHKNKLFSGINIFGLAVGIGLCFIILLYVQDELSYDRFNTNADNIARIVFDANLNGGKISESGVMPPVAQAMKADYPEVVDATRLLPNPGSKVTYGEKSFKDDRVAFVDPNFFSVFTLPFLEGDLKTALKEPHTLVLTKTTAEKYFGKDEALGKVLRFNNADLYKVTGVVNDIPSNSHFHFDMFGAMAGIELAKSDSWMFGNFYTYLLLKPGTDLKKVEAKFPAMVEKYMGPQIQRDMGLTLSQFRTKGNELGFKIQPLTSIHLSSQTTNELEPGGSASYVYIFGAIALFVLVVACINFINLSTAAASKRAKEVGVRKVAGSGRGQLIVQFLSESLLIALFALLLATALTKLALPVFNSLSGKTLSLSVKPLLALVGLGLLAGLVAGIYPAFYLSSFKPIAVLKGKNTMHHKGLSLRSGLVVFQFFVSVCLIIGTIVVYQQMKFIQEKKLGYDKEQLITLPNSWALGKNEQAYKQRMIQDPRIVNATASWFKPVGPSNSNNAMAYPKDRDNQATKTIEYHVDEQYIPTLGIRMAAGRNFSKEFATDSAGMIINEAAAKAFGWNPTTALNQTIIRVNTDKGPNFPFHVVGVVKDFHFKSLHESITPLLMTLQPEGGLIFKIKTTDVAGLLNTMKKEWEAFRPEEPFTYAFLDDLYNKTYAAEQKTATVLNIFSLFTVLVACLGLFGLATYTAERRTKEIGIRKVLGASVGQVTQMLSKEFLTLVLVASVIAGPVAWWAMNKWLQSFAYRVTVSWWVFVAAGVVASVVALATVSFRAVQAALTNPVKSLRAE